MVTNAWTVGKNRWRAIELLFDFISSLGIGQSARWLCGSAFESGDWRHSHLIGPVCVFANVCARQSYDDTKMKKKQSPDWSIQLRRGINIYILISELY